MASGKAATAAATNWCEGGRRRSTGLAGLSVLVYENFSES
jgi:hypothetical protein